MTNDWKIQSEENIITHKISGLKLIWYITADGNLCIAPLQPFNNEDYISLLGDAKKALHQHFNSNPAA